MDAFDVVILAILSFVIFVMWALLFLKDSPCGNIEYLKAIMKEIAESEAKEALWKLKYHDDIWLSNYLEHNRRTNTIIRKIVQEELAEQKEHENDSRYRKLVYRTR